MIDLAGMEVPKRIQRDMILQWLKGGHCIDALSALSKFGSNRLAARIHELRGAGYTIKTRLIKVRTRAGGSARIAVYQMVAL